MQVLEVETFGRGGLIHYAHNLSRALAARGHQVTLLTTAGYELEGEAELPQGVRLLKAIAPLSQGSAATEWPGFARTVLVRVEALIDAFRVAALARQLRPDVVHLHCTHPIALLILALMRLFGLTVATTAHVVLPHEPLRFQRAIYGRIHRLAHLVIAHSEIDRGRLRDELAVPDDRIAVIPHGEYGFFESGDEPTDHQAARHDLGLEPGDEVVLFFGYIREYKGLDLLLDAWPAVAAARPAARLVVAGDPVRLAAARRYELEDRARRLGAVCRFEYVPFAEVRRYFAAADLLVMPYRRISQSGVLYLALSLGLPVVATRVGALPEMLHDGDSALLVPPEDPASLGEALTRLLGDFALGERLADGGRQVARRHSWPAIAERTETAFAGLARG